MTPPPLPDTDKDDADTDTGGDTGNETKPDNSLVYEYDAARDCYKVVDIGGYQDSVLVVPGEYNGKPVKIIGKDAFYEC